MIVRDEQDNVQRCFKSIQHLIDAYAIVDTGSNDSTIDVVKFHAQNHRIPGKIISTPWKDFGTNRTGALHHAGNVIEGLDPKLQNNWYLFFIDADDQAIGIKINKRSLTLDQYLMETRSGNIAYQNVRFVKWNPDQPWIWRQRRHEYIAPLGNWSPTQGEIQTGYILRGTEGLRSRNRHTSLEDALELLKQFSEEPENSRAVFYAAQSFRDAGYPDLAQQMYRRRIEMGGWHQEIYQSLLYLGCRNLFQGDLGPETVNFFLQAFEKCPQRLEAPFYLLRIWRLQEQYKIGWNFAKPLLDLAPASDSLFLDREIHDWGFWEEAGLCAYYAGDKAAFKKLLNRILRAKDLPQDVRTRTRNNLKTFA